MGTAGASPGDPLGVGYVFVGRGRVSVSAWNDTQRATEALFLVLIVIIFVTNITLFGSRFSSMRVPSSLAGIKY